uniref:Plastocyanin-like domain-containing protein n=1 Tax=Quercus lobata TaxID=97700 RepID=A0A7N2L911_QUELO
MPDGDITIIISDWYSKSHKELRQDVEKGINLGVADGILIDGLDTYRFNGAVVPNATCKRTMADHFEIHRSKMW